MRVLILGGTVFLGRHIAGAALAAGHDVTLFTRGRSNPALFPKATRLIGDREGDLGALASGGEWDLVIDTSGFVPRVVLAAAALLAGRYVFVSTASVFPGWPDTPGSATPPPSTTATPTPARRRATTACSRRAASAPSAPPSGRTAA